ncbi:excinuclease ABC subunit UvrB [Mycoplasma flocculare]|uniref:UvrABC system protein B n=2 Tax=Mesomycoplasma flocculare TaxID=2128 RepID=A0A0A8E801_MESFC|nr:excinuclease ABC subunit UvrB [Mesomycoplasma flocculare]MXR39647.1 excinuclease ABC subunit UvrB [Mycoplasma sp. MF12]AJC50108.1 excinuclease ABC subunit B [Mesomycoplasma flocculare ATCC 27399]ENX50789.1 excinuclease ABC subunit B [Mesomycoplasma flocculare ATCC 27716]MXR06074.1 excinuclease ABC subunit UvrB [Mesomycoplasma flocculare]MXR56634.1 excinuclease ABC subunit UvrB [Mesomycoplasma flocculare]
MFVKKEFKKFKLNAKYKPNGDQPKAIKSLIEGIKSGKKSQILMGVTGSGKTFTMANVIAHFNKPVIILSHNKTLASQLYTEFKEFFPENRVEFYISYFDFYRPEAYLPTKDVYLEKTSKTNFDLETMRMAALNALMMRNDTIVIASVAAIYGTINPDEYQDNFLVLEINQEIKPSELALKLARIMYENNSLEQKPGVFSLKGEILEIFPAWNDTFKIRIEFFGNLIEAINTIHPISKKIIKSYNSYIIYPASAYSVKKNIIDHAIKTIKVELEEQLEFFEKNNKLVEKQRLKERVNNDIDSLSEFGICSGIENYARHIDGRQKGEKPFCLLDYLPKDGLIFIDESHIMVAQIRGMYEGDRSRKQNLVDFGFRLPSALDNRPLKLNEFEKYSQSKIYVSATPANYEIDKTNGEIVSQIIRPTGLIDPEIIVEKTENQMEKIFQLLLKQKEKNERSLILTTTKRLAEEISKYLQEQKVQKVYYLHSEMTTFERDEVIIKLRKGIYDAIVGINLLREGVDIPEVSLIFVLEADLPSFLRSKSSLIQIIGRTARNDHGKVILFADKITDVIAKVIEDNKNKRRIQIEYNKKNNIIPKTIKKPIPESINPNSLNISKIFREKLNNKKEMESYIKILEKEMKIAADENRFEEAIQIRDLIAEIKLKIE